ncbi:hypothetical protein [Acinetobacter sp. ANC 3813]|uniref:hypothetical protein n=1 Tax=Acinetobacter sp. ANC 3813 TaxID=1977873 RepID=UPI000A33D8FA|nr:hypothetical protein [Acinetobacter sp. ANC 3813]OTG90588.1 hypothetical protein B9T34_08430 [Acinetobacter sp. ANC 3813]
MIKFIIDEQALANGAHTIHNASKGCEDLPKTEDQRFLGYFESHKLVKKWAVMHWPTEKIQVCEKCCES